MDDAIARVEFDAKFRSLQAGDSFVDDSITVDGKVIRAISGRETAGTSRKDLDEAVALDATGQAAILTGGGASQVQNLSPLEVTLPPTGLDATGGIPAKRKKRNAKGPTKKGQPLTTYADNQSSWASMP